MATRYCRCGCGVELPDESRPGRKRKWATDNCRKRHWDDAPDHPCPGGCGAWISNHAAAHGHETCRPCYDREAAARRLSRLQRVADLYNAGVPLSDIAEEFGRTRTPGQSAGAAMGPELAACRELRLITTYRYRAYGGTGGDLRQQLMPGIVERYTTGRESSRSIALSVSVSEMTVRRWLRAEGVQLRSPAEAQRLWRQQEAA